MCRAKRLGALVVEFWREEYIVHRARHRCQFQFANPPTVDARMDVTTSASCRLRWPGDGHRDAKLAKYHIRRPLSPSPFIIVNEDVYRYRICTNSLKFIEIWIIQIGILIYVLCFSPSQSWNMQRKRIMRKRIPALRLGDWRARYTRIFFHLLLYCDD